MNLTQISGSAAVVGSGLIVALFALPSYIGALKQSGVVRGLLIILTLGLFAVGFETLAVKTGLPYGKFSYASNIGYRFLGATPWLVAFAYPPILLGAFWLARKISVGFLSVVFTGIFATTVYVSLAPAMAKLSLWHWETTGKFYGVPIQSFGGWLVCSIIGAIILSALWGKEEVRRLTAYSLFAIILFWSGVNLGVEQWIPAIVGIAISVLLLVLFIIEKRATREENN